jgi:hypothetical protein
MAIRHLRVCMKPISAFLPRALFPATNDESACTLTRFKYDVLPPARQREKRRSRAAQHHSKSNLDEIEEKEYELESGTADHEEVYGGETGDATSLRSSAWTSNTSKYRLGTTENGSDHSSTSSHTDGDKACVTPPNWCLVRHSKPRPRGRPSLMYLGTRKSAIYHQNEGSGEGLRLRS